MDRSEGELQLEPTGWLQRSPLLLRASVLTLIVGIFAADFFQEKVLALSTLYSIPVLISLWLDRRRFTLFSAALSCVLVPIGALYGKEEFPLELVVANRSAAVLTIAVVTSLGLLRLRTERQLVRVRNIALTTLRSLGDAVLTIDEHGYVRFVNRSAERLLGRNPKDLLAQPIGDVFLARDVDPQRPPIVELADRGVIDVREAVLFALGGRRVPIEYTRASIETGAGEHFGQVLVFRDISARKEHEEAIRRLAYRDDLTGLPNRISLLDRLQLEVAHAKRNRDQLGVVYLDLDGFKDVNDAHGHDVGDDLLKLSAERIRATLRAGDTVARLGGDEFVVLLPGIGGPAEAIQVGRKIVAAIEPEAQLGGARVAISASVGAAIYPRHGLEAETLLRRADKAMYRAKSRGPGHVELVAASDQA